jgi:hypothetical protein
MHDLGAVAGSAPDALVAAASRCGATDITEYVKEASTCLAGGVLPMSTSPLLSEVQPSAAPQSAAPIHCVLLAVAAVVVPSLAPLCYERCLRPPCCLPRVRTAHILTRQPVTQTPLLPCSCFYYSNTTATQAAAQTSCQAMGGNLATYEFMGYQACAPLLPHLG